MSESPALLAFVASRYQQAQASSDELRLRALEIIVAASVAEWLRTPKVARPLAKPVAPGPVLNTEDVPKVDYDYLVPEPELEDDEIDDVDHELDLPSSPSVEAEPEPETPSGPEGPPEGTEQLGWWDAPAPVSPEEPVRGAWEPPQRS